MLFLYPASLKYSTRINSEITFLLTANSSGVTFNTSNTTASQLLLAQSELRPSRESELLLPFKKKKKNIGGLSGKITDFNKNRKRIILMHKNNFYKNCPADRLHKELSRFTEILFFEHIQSNVSHEYQLHIFSVLVLNKG